MKRLSAYARERLKLEEPLVLAGDYNIIPTAADARNPDAWRGDALFLPQSRDAFRALVNLGFTDALRATTDGPASTPSGTIRPAPGRRTTASASIMLLLSPAAADKLTDVGIDRHVRAWEKPSDHVPLWLDLALEQP